MKQLVSHNQSHSAQKTEISVIPSTFLIQLGLTWERKGKKVLNLYYCSIITVHNQKLATNFLQMLVLHKISKFLYLWKA